MRCLLICVGIAEEIPVFPLHAGDFQSKWQAIRVEAAGHRHCRHANPVDPRSLAVRPLFRSSRKGFVIGGDLQCRIYETIEPPAFPGRFIFRQGCSLRSPEVRFAFWIGFN